MASSSSKTTAAVSFPRTEGACECLRLPRGAAQRLPRGLTRVTGHPRPQAFLRRRVPLPSFSENHPLPFLFFCTISLTDERKHHHKNIVLFACTRSPISISKSTISWPQSLLFSSIVSKDISSKYNDVSCSCGAHLPQKRVDRSSWNNER